MNQKVFKTISRPVVSFGIELRNWSENTEPENHLTHCKLQCVTVEGRRSQFYGTPRFRLNYMAHCDYHPKQTLGNALGFWSGTIPVFLGLSLTFVWGCSRYRDWDQMVRTLCDLSSLQRPPPTPPTPEQKSDVNVVRAMTSRCEYVTTAATYPEKAKLVSDFADQHQL